MDFLHLLENSIQRFFYIFWTLKKLLTEDVIIFFGLIFSEHTPIYQGIFCRFSLPFYKHLFFIGL